MAAAVHGNQNRVTDGRSARRERGRVAVTEATLALILETGSSPSAHEIAAEAGVSEASVFRYFESLDELRDATSELFMTRFAHLMEIPNLGSGTRRERIDSYIAARVQLFEMTANVLRLVRHRAFDHDSATDAQRLLALSAAHGARQHFETEISTLIPSEAETVIAIISTLTSFDTWEQMRHIHGRGPHQLTRAWSRALERILP